MGGDAAVLAMSLPCEKQECDCRRVLGEEEMMLLPADPLTPTMSPTLSEDWTVLWTEGASELSYVWIMQHENVGVQAFVLIDTTGKAQGTTMNYNETTVTFVDEVGSLYRVNTDGTDLTELVDYCQVSTCEGYGIDSWDVTERLYWVDKTMQQLLSCSYDGGDLRVIVSGLSNPYGIAVDKKRGNIYFTDSGTIYVTSAFASSTKSLQQVTSLFANYPQSYSVTNLGMDAESRDIYWTGNNTVYKGSIVANELSDITALYADVRGANSVSIDWQQDKIFFSDNDGVYYGNLQGTLSPVVVAYLYNVTFVYVKYEVTPTPSPTACPTSLPTFMPSSIPTSAPSALPTARPTSVPTKLPTSSPSSAPTSRYVLLLFLR